MSSGGQFEYLPQVKYITPEGFDLERAHIDDIGYDIRAYLPERGQITIEKRSTECIPTGLYFGSMKGVYGKIESRSGLASRGISTRGGIIDPGYRGEVKIILCNETDKSVIVSHGDKIAQLIFCPFITPDIKREKSVEESTRGTNGFGSTG